MILKTDQQSLKYITTQRLTEGIQHKLLLKLLEFDYTVEYKKGKENVVADALSRRDAHITEIEPSCNAIVTVIPEWVNDIKASYVGDPVSQQLLEELQNQPETVMNYSLIAGLIRYKGRILVGTGNEMRQTILANFHSSIFGGHSGRRATYQRIKKLFFFGPIFRKGWMI